MSLETLKGWRLQNLSKQLVSLPHSHILKKRKQKDFIQSAPVLFQFLSAVFLVFHPSTVKSLVLHKEWHTAFPISLTAW